MSQVGQSEIQPMTYERLQQLRPSAFKRRCGVHRQTFFKLVSVLRPYLDRQGKGGGQCKLSVEDQLLVALEYWREYRTQFHIAESWGISESSVCRIVQKVENLLLQSGEFSLPGKQRVYRNAYEWSVVVVDGSQTPIERPKKTTSVLQWQEKGPYLESPTRGGPSEWTNSVYSLWQRTL